MNDRLTLTQDELDELVAKEASREVRRVGRAAEEAVKKAFERGKREGRDEAVRFLSLAAQLNGHGPAAASVVKSWSEDPTPIEAVRKAMATPTAENVAHLPALLASLSPDELAEVQAEQSADTNAIDDLLSSVEDDQP